MKASAQLFELQKLVGPNAKGPEKILQILRRGLALQQSGKLKEAEYCYQLVLRDNPDHPEALNLLGTLASKAKNHAIAIECLTKAVSAQPNNVFYRNNLGFCLNAARRAREAIPHFEKAMAAQPRMLEPLMGLAHSHKFLGNGEEAEKALRRALLLAPENKRSRILLGEVLIDLGRIKEAAIQFRETLANDPQNIPAIVGLASAREAGEEEGDFERFEYALTDQSLEPDKRAALHTALGQILDHRKKPREAFLHFMEANRLEKTDFSLMAFRQQIDDTIALFTPFFFLSKQDFGSDSERPILVVGMPRSGTTLTEQILSSHPLIEGAGELSDLKRLHDLVASPPQWRQGITALGEAKCKELSARYLAELDRHSRTAAHVVDKMPHNFLLLGFIALLFPRARIIHCRRDPMDNCVSCYTHRFNKAHGYSTDMKTMGLYYREYRRLMQHWRKVLPLKMLELDYEEMIADQETMSRRLIDFAGLEWDDACLNFHQTERTVRTLSRWQVRQPIYKSSVQRWRKYDEFLGPMKEGLGDLFANKFFT